MALFVSGKHIQMVYKISNPYYPETNGYRIQTKFKYYFSAAHLLLNAKFILINWKH